MRFHKSTTVALLAIVLASSIGVQAVTIDWVTVGNPGNAGELSGSGAGGFGPDRICGAVDYAYNIGKFEVTAGQYCEFLNAVATDDTHGLYNAYMNYDLHPDHLGCNIIQSGSSGSYTYSVVGDWAERPVNYVSWYDTLRFVNWMHNGQPTGAQDSPTTEDGAYDMSLGSSVVRKPGALVFLPAEDEWYKAAYYNPATGTYFDYPTSNDSVPSNTLDGGGNNATYYITSGDYTIGNPYYRTEVGAHENSDSPYGTFDQGGNVWEWNEAVLPGSHRGLRGGSFSVGGGYLRASNRIIISRYSPTCECGYIGFRVAAVPEPDSIALLALGGVVARRRRRK